MDSSTALRFGPFELQPQQRRLLRDGAPVVLGARAFDVLAALVLRRERVVTKAELLDLAWPGLVVEENNLQVQISALRKLLGPQAISTIPGRGYRFTAAADGTIDDRQRPIEAVHARAAPGMDPRERRVANLPAKLAPLYGRDQDLAALRTLIEEHRLVTVVGAGGIGKSRLAQATAHALADRWADGAWMVELAGLSDPALLPSAVAQVLEIKTSGPDTATDSLIGGLAQRSVLLVLDNCEHLLEAVASLVQAVLYGAPHVFLLTTSQEPLHLPDEQQYRVMPLGVPSQASTAGARESGAVALFAARARAVDPRFALTDENLGLVIDVCRRLDGLPLAIELAAARVASLGLRPLRDKLDARFRLLTGGSRAALRRHQTLRAALEWSHHLLNEEEKTVFRRLGVFAGGFTVALAQAVCTDERLDEWAVLDHLSALVDKSLVVADAGDVPRYRLLESARAFALEQLAAGETAQALRRHAQAMRDFMRRVDDANLDGELRTDQYAALVLPELDNLRAAYAWATGDAGDVQIAIALAAHAGALIDYAIEFSIWLPPLQQQVEHGAVDDATAARYWRAITAGNMVGHVPSALQIEAASRARTLYLAMGQPRRVFSCLIQLARHHSAQQRDGEAQAAMDEARSLIQPDWPAEFRIHMLRRDAWLARVQGRIAESLTLFREAHRASVATGDWRLEVIDGSNVVDALWNAGAIDEAAQMVGALVDELRRRPAADSEMAVTFANLIGILSELGRIDEASAAARDALPVMRRSQTYFPEEWVHLFWRRGQFETAVRLLGYCDAEVHRTGVPFQVNEARLIAQARTALEAQLSPGALATAHAAGAALSKAEVLALISAAIENASGEPGR